MVAINTFDICCNIRNPWIILVFTPKFVTGLPCKNSLIILVLNTCNCICSIKYVVDSCFEVVSYLRVIYKSPSIIIRWLSPKCLIRINTTYYKVSSYCSCLYLIYWINCSRAINVISCVKMISILFLNTL